MKLMVQDGITPQDCYLFIDINAPTWAHDMAQYASFERMSTYQQYLDLLDYLVAKVREQRKAAQ